MAVPMQDLHLYKKNPRHGDVGALSEALRVIGQTKPIIVQKSTGTIIGGNHLYRAASALGWTEIAVNFVDVDDTTADFIALQDNRMADLGTYDEADLAKLLADVASKVELEGSGYDTDDLDALLAKVGTGKGYGKGDPDKQGAIPDEPWVKDGMMFALGDHRIACGDGTVLGVLDRLLEGAKPDLLIIQPPSGKGQYPKDIFDHLEAIPEQFWFEPHRYDLWQVSPDLGVKGSGSFLVWDKGSENTQRDFGDAFELIYSKTQHTQAILRHTLVGAADGDLHGGPDFNERPTALFSDIYERWSGFEALVLDPIALGGTALLAAEKAGRKYYGVKKDPAYVQATLEKWEEYSSVKAMEIK